LGSQKVLEEIKRKIAKLKTFLERIEGVVVDTGLARKYEFPNSRAIFSQPLNFYQIRDTIVRV
jgi:hypothetical protein